MGECSALVALVVIVVLVATWAITESLGGRLLLGAVLAAGLIVEGTLPTWLATVGRRGRRSVDV